MSQQPKTAAEQAEIPQDQTVPRSNTDNAPRSAIHQTLYSADTFAQHNYLAGKKLPDIVRPQAGQTNWLHFVGINNAALLKHTLEPYGIHELVIEDILSRKQRPKIEDYDNYLFIAAQVYHYTAAGKLNSDQVYLIIGKDFVLSFQQKPLGLFSQLRRQMSENPRGILGKNTAFLAYCLLDRIVDDYFIVLEEYNNRVEAIDKSLFKDENSDILGKIHRLKRDAVRLRRTLLPLRDVFYQLAVRGDFAIFKGESTVYLRDVYDHNMQLIESLDASRDMVLSMMDIYLSFQSNRMNQQMRVLTVITIIFMPLTVITGIYGMNFDNMPELHWHYGYFMVLGLMLCIIVGLLIFFSRRKWL